MKLEIKNDRSSPLGEKDTPITLQVEPNATIESIIKQVNTVQAMGENWCLSQLDNKRLSPTTSESVDITVTDGDDVYDLSGPQINVNTAFVTFYNKLLEKNEKATAVEFECKESVLQINNLMISLYTNHEEDHEIKKVSEYRTSDSESKEFFMACDSISALNVDLQISKTEWNVPLMYGVRLNHDIRVAAVPFLKSVNVPPNTTVLDFEVLAPMDVDFTLHHDMSQVIIERYEDSSQSLGIDEGTVLQLRSSKLRERKTTLADYDITGDVASLLIVGPRTLRVEVGSHPRVMKFELIANCNTIDDLKIHIARCFAILPNSMELELKQPVPQGITPLKQGKSISSYTKLKNDSTIILNIKSNTFVWKPKPLLDIHVQLVSSTFYRQVISGELEFGGSDPGPVKSRRNINGTPPSSQPSTQTFGSNRKKSSLDESDFAASQAAPDKTDNPKPTFDDDMTLDEMLSAMPEDESERNGNAKNSKIPEDDEETEGEEEDATNPKRFEDDDAGGSIPCAQPAPSSLFKDFSDGESDDIQFAASEDENDGDDVTFTNPDAIDDDVTFKTPNKKGGKKTQAEGKGSEAKRSGEGERGGESTPPSQQNGKTPKKDEKPNKENKKGIETPNAENKKGNKTPNKENKKESQTPNAENKKGDKTPNKESKKGKEMPNKESEKKSETPNKESEKKNETPNKENKKGDKTPNKESNKENKKEKKGENNEESKEDKDENRSGEKERGKEETKKRKAVNDGDEDATKKEANKKEKIDKKQNEKNAKEKKAENQGEKKKKGKRKEEEKDESKDKGKKGEEQKSKGKKGKEEKSKGKKGKEEKETKEEGEEDEEEYKIGKLVDMKVTADKTGKMVRKFKAHWTGFQDSDDTWETEKDLKENGYDEMISKYLSNTKTKKQSADTNKAKKKKKKEEDEKEEEEQKPEKPKKTTKSTAKETKSKPQKRKKEDEDERSYFEEQPDSELQKDQLKEKYRKITGIYGARMGNNRELESHAEWPNGNRAYVSATLVRKYVPNILLDFYESKLRFVSDNKE